MRKTEKSFWTFSDLEYKIRERKLEMKKNIIWSSDICLADWEDYLQQEYPDVTDEYKKYELCTDTNYMYLDDERDNLNIATDGEIICIANLGLWNGSRNAYKLLGNNIKNILYPQIRDTCENEWYSDGKNICCTESHHDGTNFYTFRVLKGNTHDEQIENAEKLFSAPLTARRIGRFTKSILPSVASVYGW